jgi:NAD(P)-dependent dehydrogenase (short-subunit alcohol dehydrogenase family)
VDLADKAIIITGAANGIGKATAELAASRGARCFLSDIARDGVEVVADEIRAKGGQASAFACDVTSHEQIGAFVDDVLDAAGHIDGLVNNAGVINMESLFDITPQSWTRVFDVNVSGVFFMLQAVAKTMVERGVSGRIVNIASEAGRRGSELCAHYGASKTAVISITRSAALALTRHGILVNAVAPGLIQTAMWDSIDQQLADRGDFGPGEIKRVGIAATPIGRAAVPAEVAACVCFLLSDDARYVAGHTLDVNGGRFMS